MFAVGLWRKLFGGQERTVKSEPRDRSRHPAEINAGPRIGEVSYHPEKSILVPCCQCGFQVVVDKRRPVNSVYCMQCAMDLVKKNNLKAELRVPFD